MARALAHIEKVEWVKPIEGADNIELIGVLGWVCIARKNEFKEGDKAVYIEVDSLCPSDDERFAFLASKKYRIKTLKFSKFNVISQGLALPIEQFPELRNNKIGDDVTEKLKITYYNPEDRARKSNGSNPNAKYRTMMQRHKKLFKNPIAQKIMKTSIGKKIMFLFFGKKKDNPKNFPNWIVKTDETRIENMPWLLNSDDEWVVSEKIDGTSTTFFLDCTHRKPEFGVCSRNVRQKDENQDNYVSKVGNVKNVYWEMAFKYNIEKVLKDIANRYEVKRVVLQGETYGESVQGNQLKIKGRDFAAFNLIFDGVRLGSVEARDILNVYKIPFVPIIETHYMLPDNMEEFKLEADGYSMINPKAKREGFVYRKPDGQFSFKSVSREYLLKHHQ